jgi:hypothetical protein
VFITDRAAKTLIAAVTVTGIFTGTVTVTGRFVTAAAASVSGFTGTVAAAARTNSRQLRE